MGFCEFFFYVREGKGSGGPMCSVVALLCPSAEAEAVKRTEELFTSLTLVSGEDIPAL